MREHQARNGVLYTEYVPLRAGLPLSSLWCFESASADTSRAPVRTNTDGTQSYWLSEHDPLLNTILPSTHVSLVINMADRWAAGRSLMQAELLPHACVIGPMTQARVVRVGRRVRAVGAAFPAAMATTVFGAPASALVDRIVPLAKLWSPAIVDQLVEIASPMTIRDSIVDRYRPSRAHIVRDATDALTWGGGRLPIHHLARSCGVSRRTLTRGFVGEIGISPKLYARIARFNQLVFALLSTDVSRWTTISGDVGFYDQPHMVNEFRQFTGLAPTRFFQPHDAALPRPSARLRGRPSEWMRDDPRHST
jgi:AraC-like DNA-binding protein